VHLPDRSQGPNVQLYEKYNKFVSLSSFLRTGAEKRKSGVAIDFGLFSLFHCSSKREKCDISHLILSLMFLSHHFLYKQADKYFS
jgi:hypothetical protein